MTDPVEFTDEHLAQACEFAATATQRRYRRHVDHGKILDELYDYANGPGRKHITKWLATGQPDQMLRALFNVAKQYAERQKAKASGYHFDDIHWYSTDRIVELLPLALDDSWDGLTGEDDEPHRGGSAGSETGGLLASVADVRAALRALPAERLTLLSFDQDSDEYGVAVSRVCDWLGGPFPAADGYRRRKARA